MQCRSNESAVPLDLTAIGNDKIVCFAFEEKLDSAFEVSAESVLVELQELRASPSRVAGPAVAHDNDQEKSKAEC